MTVKELRQAIETKDDDLEIYFRRIAPIAGNIEAAGIITESTYGFFGKTMPCLIIEPMKDDF